VGPSFLNGTDVPGEALYRYPNNQSARLVWCHDHAIGITRLNAFAGIASDYITGDDVENFLITSHIIPSNEVPLVIQDKTFGSPGRRMVKMGNQAGFIPFPVALNNPPTKFSVQFEANGTQSDRR